MGPGPGHTGLMTPWWQQPHQFCSIGQLNQLSPPRQQHQLTLLLGCCWQDHQTGNIHDKKRQEWQTRVQNPPPPYNHLFSWLLDNYKHFVKKLKEWKQIIDTLPKSCNIHHKEVKVGSMWPVVGPSDTQLTQLHLLISRPSVAVPKTWWPAASCPLPLISLPSLDTALTQQPATALFQLPTKQTALPRQLWSQRMQLGGNVVIWLLFENVDGDVTIKTYQPPTTHHIPI